MTVFSWLKRRERGLRSIIGERESIYQSLYIHIDPYNSWNTSSENSEYGGVYNLEFSPDGSLMVAACEKRSIVLFDPITNRKTNVIKNAHRDCVNCVKFLDDRMFATCSDDSTVALWDTRNLKSKIRSLHGHLNWVKNIEYSRKDSLLVTSGFDGSIFTWDINSNTEQGFVYQKVFHTPGLMRCRISPDATKLVICTTGGYLIIIHNLDLTTLANDLSGFRPNIYRLMQLGRQMIPYAAKYNHIFSNEMKKNRVELVSDFPADNDAEVISSLQIHPEGWCALSRNVSYDESSEWTCIHDIQEYKSIEDDDNNDTDLTSTKRKAKNTKSSHRLNRSDARTLNMFLQQNQLVVSQPQPQPIEQQQNNRPEVPITTHPDIWAAEVTVRDRMLGNQRLNITTEAVGNTHVYGISSGVLQHQQQHQQTVHYNTSVGSEPAVNHQSTNDQPSSTSNVSAATAAAASAYDELNEEIINQNVRRMLYYIEEPNKGRGFIKELCFSADGRIICSPFGFGFRLLAFSPNCGELSTSINPNGEEQPLTELKYIKCHSDIVVSTKFSPRQSLLASGCLRGKVMWHQPKF